MRLSIFITLSFLLCTLFCQCNGDIFVEEFAPAATEYTLNGDGDSITIQFASGDWMSAEDISQAISPTRGRYAT